MEPSFDAMDGTAKELRHLHGVTLSTSTENILEQLHIRWEQLKADCKGRINNMQALTGSALLTPVLEGKLSRIIFLRSIFSVLYC